jgi:hypothetical protein
MKFRKEKLFLLFIYFKYISFFLFYKSKTIQSKSRKSKRFHTHEEIPKMTKLL